MNYKTNLIVIMLVAASAFALLLSCGDDDCPVCPECPSEPDYHLLYSYVRPNYEPVDYVVTTYSLKSGLLIDSTCYSCYPFDAVTFSPDGKYSYYTRRSVINCEHSQPSTWVTDTRTGDTLAFDPEHGGIQMAISADGQYIATSLTTRTAIYKVPELTPVFEENDGSFHSENMTFHPRKKVVVVAKSHKDSLYVYSFESDSLELISAIPLTNLAGDPLVPGVMSFVPSGDSLVVLGIKGPGVLFFQILNTTDYSVEFELRLAPWQSYGQYIWHPDGKRLFMPWNGGFDNPEMGGIDVYDLTTGIFESFVNADYYNLGAPWFMPRYLAFTPNGKQMAVLNGWGFGTWPVHVIDMATKQIVRDFKHNDFGNTRAMALIPIDWEKEK